MSFRMEDKQILREYKFEVFIFLYCLFWTNTITINYVNRVVTVQPLLLSAERARVFLGQLFICLGERVEFIKLRQIRSYTIRRRIIKRVSTSIKNITYRNKKRDIVSWYYISHLTLQIIDMYLTIADNNSAL